jgi:hypothetical protein
MMHTIFRFHWELNGSRFIHQIQVDLQRTMRVSRESLTAGVDGSEITSGINHNLDRDNLISHGPTDEF